MNNKLCNLFLVLMLLSGCTLSTQIPDTSTPHSEASQAPLVSTAPPPVSKTARTENERNLDASHLTQLTGAQVAQNLNARYTEERYTCDSNTTLPLYYCSGVIIRSTEDGNFDPWNPSPSAIKLGGVSFSYMRLNALVNDLYHRSGFIFLPQEQAIAQGKQVNYLCIYPFDAGTIVGIRSGQGCGLKPRGALTSDISTCSTVGAATSKTAWYMYTVKLPNRDYQRSLSTQQCISVCLEFRGALDSPTKHRSIVE